METRCGDATLDVPAVQGLRQVDSLGPDVWVSQPGPELVSEVGKEPTGIFRDLKIQVG